MRCVVLEISGGGAEINPPPAGSRLAQTPAGARVKILKHLASFVLYSFKRMFKTRLVRVLGEQRLTVVGSARNVPLCTRVSSGRLTESYVRVS